MVFRICFPCSGIIRDVEVCIVHQPIQLARQWFDKNFTLRGLFTLIVLIFCAVPDWKSRGEYWEQILYWDAIKTFVFSGWGRFTIICIGALIIWLDHRTVIKRKNRTPSQANAKHDWNVGAKPRELRIKSAIYGVGDSRYKDVTPQIKAHIKDNRIHLLVCNDTLLSGADPYYKERKHLIVEYSLGGGLTEEIVRQEQDYLELPEGNEPKQPEQDDPLCKALKAIAAEDAEKIWTKLHECGWRAEFHNPGFDPYLDIFIDLLNASIFEMVTVGKID